MTTPGKDTGKRLGLPLKTLADRKKHQKKPTHVCVGFVAEARRAGARVLR